MKKSCAAVALVLCLLALAAYLYLLQRDAVADKEAEAPQFVKHGDEILVPENSPLRQRLQSAAVGEQEAAHSLSVAASVEADPARTVNILPPVAGRIVALKVGLGERVKAGQVLAVLASGDYAQAVADLAKAQDAQQLNAQALARARKVYALGGNAAKDLEQAQSSYNQAAAEYRRAAERMRALGAASGGKRQLAIVAPMAGSISALSVAPGSFVNDPTAAIMTLSNLDKVWITANVAEEAIASIGPGQTVSVSLPAYPGERFAGKVALVSPVVDADTRSEKVRIAFDNRDGRFKPNMFAQVAFAVTEGQRITVPASALLMNNDRTTVFVETRPWTFVRRSVDIGYDDNAQVTVLAGLAAGERIVVKGGVLLND